VIPATRWRRAAAGTVLAADAVVVLAGAAVLPGFVPFALVLLAGATVWGLMRPGGWGAFVLVLVQALCVGVPRGAPVTLTDWAVSAVCAAAVLATHVSCALLAAWPAGAALPRETAARWLRQTGALVGVVLGATVLGLLFTATPYRWAPWILAVALTLVAGVGALLWAGAGRRRA
jgi:hypothetical protein